MDKFTVRDSNGSVDVGASLASYSKAINDWVSVNETPVEVIERAVEAVFDSHTSRLPTPFLASLAVQEMNADPERFQSLTNRVTTYIKGQVASGRFDSTKGKGGGIARLARPGEPLPSKG
jgi:hypothetical protein